MHFDFPYHTFETEYPSSGFKAQLGNSYQFDAPPSAPDQRKFTLKFKTMRILLNTDGTIDVLTSPQINMGTLDAFYNKHKMFAVFIYHHPMYGDLPCKFNKPLKIPKGLENGGGALSDFEVELIEVPGMASTFS